MLTKHHRSGEMNLDNDNVDDGDDRCVAVNSNALMFSVDLLFRKAILFSLDVGFRLSSFYKIAFFLFARVVVRRRNKKKSNIIKSFTFL